jgi:hypothetical protein
VARRRQVASSGRRGDKSNLRSFFGQGGRSAERTGTRGRRPGPDGAAGGSQFATEPGGGPPRGALVKDPRWCSVVRLWGVPRDAHGSPLTSGAAHVPIERRSVSRYVFIRSQPGAGSSRSPPRSPGSTPRHGTAGGGRRDLAGTPHRRRRNDPGPRLPHLCGGGGGAVGHRGLTGPGCPRNPGGEGRRRREPTDH